MDKKVECYVDGQIDAKQLSSYCGGKNSKKIDTLYLWKTVYYQPCFQSGYWSVSVVLHFKDLFQFNCLPIINELVIYLSLMIFSVLQFLFYSFSLLLPMYQVIKYFLIWLWLVYFGIRLYYWYYHLMTFVLTFIDLYYIPRYSCWCRL